MKLGIDRLLEEPVTRPRQSWIGTDESSMEDSTPPRRINIQGR